MKILLIYPYFLEERIHTDDIHAVPMGLYSIGALLIDRGFEVEILNFSHLTNKSPEIRNLLSAKQPDVIGFSILHANRWGGIEIARLAKELNPKVTTVFGGVGATFLWELLLNHFPEIDYAVVGEGEQPFLQLLQRLSSRKPGSVEDIPGLALRKNGKATRNPPPPLTQHMDTLPNPAKHFTYQHVSVSRGCAGKCTFCGSPRIWGKTVRFHSAEYFVDQVEMLARKGVSFFYFSDDTFTAQKNRVIDICKGIIDRGLQITWAAISRVNFVNPEMLFWMRKAGCVQISYGVESGSEKIRKGLNKHISAAQIKKAFSLTRQHGIMARAYFIYGCPGETRETIQETIDLIHEIKPLSVIFYILDVFPGTQLYETCRERFNLQDSIWLQPIEDILYVELDPHLSREQVLAFGQKLRQAFHLALPEFVDAIDLLDHGELYPFHADFLSRLAMTFTHGDYATVEIGQSKEEVAERLYRRALEYHPDHRAYLGIAILQQQKRDFNASMAILEDGLHHFPESEALNTCMALNHMNLGQFRKAVDRLIPFKKSPQAAGYLEACYREIDNPSKS